MKTTPHNIYLILVFSVFLTFSSYATTYYIDAFQGNDTNSGKSPSSAWATLKKANTTIFNQFKFSQ